MRPVLLGVRGAIVVLAVSLILAVGPARAAGPGLDRGEAAVVRGLNRVRALHHLPRLRAIARLDAAADLHSGQMLSGGYFSHGAFASRVHRFVQSRAIGETLAKLDGSVCRHRGVRRVVSMWLNSPPHRAIVLSPAYRRVGVGRRRNSGACLVTADFASAR
jgi:uncharacterized protein YkwD